MYVADHAASYENVLDGGLSNLQPKKRSEKTEEEEYQMRVFQFFEHRDVVQLDVEELVNRFQRAGDGDVVFELDGDRMVDEGFKKA